MKILLYIERAIAVTSFCCLCAFANAQNADERLIRDSRQKSNEAIAKQDTAALAIFWLDDVYVITSRSISVSGRLANQRAFQQEFQSKDKLLYVRTPGTIEVFPNWNMAAEYGKWVGTWISKGSSIRISGTYYAKWHSVKGKWKIKSETYTPSSCEGGDYCKVFDLR